MGKPNVTIYDIAALAGVSPTTVSRVLNNKGYPVSETSRQRVLDAALQLGYFPKKRAAKKSSSSLTVYAVIPSITNPYYSQLVMGVEGVLQKRGDIKMVLFNTKGDPKIEREFTADIARNSHNCMGTLIASISTEHEHLLQLQYAGVRMVAFDQHVDLNCHMVRFNYRKGGHMAATHLINTGRRRIGFISSPLTRFSRREVYTGFCSALEQHGIEIDRRYIKIANTETAFPDRMCDFNNGLSLVQKMIAEDCLPEGLFCINDVTAAGALCALRNQNIQVPGQVGVVGFDNIFVSQIVTPKLTTIDQSTLKMGELAADILLDKKSQEDEKIIRITLEPTLTIREST